MSRFEITPAGAGNGSGSPFQASATRADYAGVPEVATGLRDLLRVIRRNGWLILLIAGATVGISAYLSAREVPVYRASGVIRLADTRGSISGGIGDAAVEGMIGATSDPLLSQLEVLKGRTVLGEVVDREGLRLAPASAGLHGLLDSVQVNAPDEASAVISLTFTSSEVVAEAGAATARAPYAAPVVLPGLRFALRSRPDLEEATLMLHPRDAAIDGLARGLTARPRDRTDAVEVQYAANDPALAQRVVNSAIEVFQATSANAAQEQSRRRRLFLEAQLASVDSVLASMQGSLSGFRSENQVFSSREKITAQQEGLMGLEVRLQELTADRRMYQSLLTELGGRGANRTDVLRTLVSSPGVASNAVVAQLYTQLVQYERSRDSLVTGALGATAQHPDVQRLTALITTSQQNLVDAIRSHVASIDARIAALDTLRSRNAAEIGALPATEAEEVRLVQQVETTRQMGDELRTELQKARIAEAVEAGQVEIVNRAPLPREPLSGGGRMKLVLALVLGLILGGGAAFVREHLNTTIRRRDEVEELLRVPGLAVIPQMARMHASALGRSMRLAIGRGDGGRRAAATPGLELVAISDLHSASAEAFRMLRTNLLFSQEAAQLKTIVVTSATPGEGKTTTAANLAATYAQQGMSVLLVDCDLRRARLHKLFHLAPQPGLTELILGYQLPQETIRRSEVEGLSVLPAGTLPPNPAEILGGARMKRVLEVLAEGFDLIILDTPPLMAAADAAILGARADGVLLVVRAGQTERGMAQFAMQQLQGVGARVVGAVLNDPDAQVPLYGGYYYYDYYATEGTVV